MRWFLNDNETIITNYTKEEILSFIKAETKEELAEKNEDKIKELYHFTGKIGKDCFEISKLVKYGQNFIPIIRGNIEEGSKGSIVSISYQLFPGTKVLFWFWTIVCLFISISFSYLHYNKLMIISSLIFLILNCLQS